PCSELSLSYHSYSYHRDLHSFPTRRSSDLTCPPPCRPSARRSRSRTRCVCSRAPTPCWCTRTVPPWASSPGTTCWPAWPEADPRSEEHTSELQSRENLVCRLLLEKKK